MSNAKRPSAECNPPASPVTALLAVDLGVRSGFALYGPDGRLVRYSSQNFGSMARLRKAIPGLLKRDDPRPSHLVLEGPTNLARAWEHAAEKIGNIKVIRLYAETWRRKLMLSREQRSGAEAKRFADRAARQVIAWSGAPAPTSLRHDAAEAILIGLWAVLDSGLLRRLPAQLTALK